MTLLLVLTKIIVILNCYLMQKNNLDLTCVIKKTNVFSTSAIVLVFDTYIVLAFLFLNSLQNKDLEKWSLQYFGFQSLIFLRIMSNLFPAYKNLETDFSDYNSSLQVKYSELNLKWSDKNWNFNLYQNHCQIFEVFIYRRRLWRSNRKFVLFDLIYYSRKNI